MLKGVKCSEHCYIKPLFYKPVLRDPRCSTFYSVTAPSTPEHQRSLNTWCRCVRRKDWGLVWEHYNKCCFKIIASAGHMAFNHIKIRSSLSYWTKMPSPPHTHPCVFYPSNTCSVKNFFVLFCSIFKQVELKEVNFCLRVKVKLPAGFALTEGKSLPTVSSPPPRLTDCINM